MSVCYATAGGGAGEQEREERDGLFVGAARAVAEGDDEDRRNDDRKVP